METLEFYENKIKENKKLQHIFDGNLIKKYYDWFDSKNMNHIQKCVLETKKYKFMNEYLDLYLSKNNSKINKSHKNTQVSLILAVRYYNYFTSYKTVRILIKHGAHVNYVDNFGTTPLKHLMYYPNTKTAVKICKLLLKHNADINIRDKNGSTILIHLCINSHSDYAIDIIKILINHKIDLHAVDKYNMNALVHHCQTFENNIDFMLVEILLSYDVPYDETWVETNLILDSTCSIYHPNMKLMNLITKNRKKVIKSIQSHKFYSGRYDNIPKIKNVDYKNILISCNSFSTILTNF